MEVDTVEHKEIVWCSIFISLGFVVRETDLKVQFLLKSTIINKQSNLFSDVNVTWKLQTIRNVKCDARIMNDLVCLKLRYLHATVE